MKIDAHDSSPIHVELIERGPLTRREWELLPELCTGRSKREIARLLCRSQHTIVRHVANIEAKLAARSLAQAVAHAVARGLIRISLRLVVMLLAAALLAPNERAMARPLRVPRPVASRVLRDGAL